MLVIYMNLYIKREHVIKKDGHDNIPHFHNDIELICVLKGTMDCQTNKEVFPLSKGDICFINKNQIHNLYTDSDSEHINLICSSKLFTGDNEIYDKYIKPVIDDLSFSHVKFDSTLGYTSKIYDLILEIETLLNKKSVAYELDIISNLHTIFKHLYIAYTKGYNKTKVIDENTIIQHKMIDFIKKNYAQELTLDDIAGSANVSISKCSRVFKEYTRMSPITYLNNFRINMAASMIIKSSETISSIAMECGFSSQSYFNRLFLKEYGVTPKEYRHKKQKELL